MGLFDTFVLKEPIQCPRCKTGEHAKFQTKDLDCLLYEYHEGEIAGIEELRPYTKEENETRIKENKEKYGEGVWAETVGILGGVPTGRIINILKDGKYPAYDYCKKCKDFFYIVAVVENGIFTYAISEKISINEN